MTNRLFPVTGTSAALRVSLAIARNTREIATAWSTYHRDVARQASEAGLALLRARSLKEMLEVQTNLLCGTMRSFRGRMEKIAEAASQIARRPPDALNAASVQQAAAAPADDAAVELSANAGRRRD